MNRLNATKRSADLRYNLLKERGDILRFLGILSVCIVFLYSTTQREEVFLQKLKMQPVMHFSDLYRDYFKPSPLDQKGNEIEEEFRVWDADSNGTAIDFSLMRPDNIVTLTDTYGVLFFNDDDFYKYGILTDKDAKVLSVLLLAYRKGMRDWQIERDVLVKPDRNTLFLVTDEFRDAEWIDPQIKGDMLVNDQRRYIVTVDAKGRFHIVPTSTRKLYEKEDKRLNTLYRKVMKKLHRSEQKQLKDIQRAWVAYMMKKCNTFLVNETGQSDDTVHVSVHKEQCFYDETKRRADELDEMNDYFGFYR